MHEICMKRQPTMRRSVGRRFQAAGIIKKLKKKKSKNLEAGLNLAWLRKEG